jgi:hypothetical protein
MEDYRGGGRAFNRRRSPGWRGRTERARFLQRKEAACWCGEQRGCGRKMQIGRMEGSTWLRDAACSPESPEVWSRLLPGEAVAIKSTGEEAGRVECGARN